MTFFEYHVKWYDINDKLIETKGLVIGKNYSSAIAHVVFDYGEENIINIFLQEICLDSQYTIESEDIKDQFNFN